MADSCLKKRKHEKRESILLDSRQPFMNRVCNPFDFAQGVLVAHAGLFTDKYVVPSLLHCL
jgi:hypothetical protein